MTGNLTTNAPGTKDGTSVVTPREAVERVTAELRNGTGLSETVSEETGGVIRDAWVHSTMQKAADLIERQAESLEAMASALEGLVRMNEEHNAAVEQVIGRPLNWSDDYLDIARTTLTQYRKTGDL